jgi:hypothetical protein
VKLREDPLKLGIKRQISATDDLHESTATKRPACRKKLPIFQVSVAGENTRKVPGDLRLTVARTQED